MAKKIKTARGRVVRAHVLMEISATVSVGTLL